MLFRLKFIGLSEIKHCLSIFHKFVYNIYFYVVRDILSIYPVIYTVRIKRYPEWKGKFAKKKRRTLVWRMPSATFTTTDAPRLVSSLFVSPCLSLPLHAGKMNKVKSFPMFLGQVHLSKRKTIQATISNL